MEDIKITNTKMYIDIDLLNLNFTLLNPTLLT
jgi:hypothetical protein